MTDEEAFPNDLLGEGVISQRAMYENWVAAGFTPEQALELTKTVILAVLRKEGLC